jgi:XTP/dITP diphosphohydrolase
LKILLATLNAGKRREVASLLTDLPIEVTGLADLHALPECIESGATFMDNAVIKARHYGGLTGMAALADDSGLVIDALGGMPGVYSARFGGPGVTDAQKMQKVLALMREVPVARRQARFVCALAFFQPGREIHTIEETADGVIALEPAGSRGFGYDPIFLVPELGKTFAQLAPEGKNRISHRGKALMRFRHFLIDTCFPDENSRS